MMNTFLEFIHGLDLPGAFLFLGFANVLIFAVSVAACWWLGRRFHSRRLFDRWQPFSAVEGLAA